VKRLRGALSDKIEQVILDFKDVRALSSEAMAFLSRKGFLQMEEGNLWRSINPSLQNQ
jgi:hypothetical protein